jgi:lipoprotein NlpD
MMIAACASGRHYGPTTYVVQPQDTLYSIAWRHDLDFRDLARWNNIRTDARLAVGQVLVLEPDGRALTVPPPAQVTAAATVGTAGGPPAAGWPAPSSRYSGVPRVSKPIPLTEAPGGSTPPPATASSSAPGSSPPTAASPHPRAADGRSKWVWPTDRSSPPRPVPGGGILLLGRLGQDVRAAGSGRVVYTGSGLRGYGNLIIIKHGESLLSSYAHNRELLVHEGQDVAAGQVIAHMGTGPHQVSALYFEIRVNGKPTDPLRYLSQ